MWNGTNDATLSYRPQLPSIEWNHPQSLPVANRSGNINDYSPLSPVMPHLSLLSTGVTDHHPHFFAGNAPSNGQAEVTQGSLLLGSATPSSPPLVFNAYGSYLTRGSSTSRPDISASTPSGTGLLLVPVSRRHSLNAQRPVGGFFLESEATTPDTPSPSSPFSSFSSSTSASEGSSPAGPPVHLHVGSPANVAASTGRRKKPAKFGCMYCPATFTARHNLRNHLNAHAGVRPHLCPLCQYGFTTMAVMKRHQRKCKALPNVGPSFQPLHHQE